MDITPTMLRTLGGLFELAGLALVAWGISDLRRRFSNRPSSVEAAKLFARRMWFRLTGRREEALPITPRTTTVRKTMESRWNLEQREMTLEEKVGWLMGAVGRLEKRDGELAERIAAEEEQRRQSVQEEEQLRKKAVNQLATKVQDLATGDLTRQFWGVIAFGFGIILQVWSQEFARWL